VNPQTHWWLHQTAAGRRVLDRVVPRSAIPPHTRRQICRESGHDLLPDNTCRRCGERLRVFTCQVCKRREVVSYPSGDAFFCHGQKMHDSSRDEKRRR
jgi:hypothetical protein